MSATTTVASTGVEYAPEDPTLPKPWRGLVDSETGYLYYWNTETNVTQYEKPVSSSHHSSGSSKTLNSSVQLSSEERRTEERRSDNYVNGYSRASNDVAKKTLKSRFDDSPDPDVSITGGYSSFGARGSENGLSADSYRRRHEITVTGGNVPQPFSSFEDTGFPAEILREMRYLLQGRSKMSQAVPPLYGFGAPSLVDQLLGYSNHPCSWPQLLSVVIQWSE